MAKKAGRPKGTRGDVSVKIDEDIIDLARVVAAHRKLTLNEFLSGLLRDPVKRAHTEMAKELSRGLKGGGV